MVRWFLQINTKNWETIDRLFRHGVFAINLAILKGNLKGSKKIWEKYEELLNLKKCMEPGEIESGMRNYPQETINDLLEKREQWGVKTSEELKQKIREFFMGLMNDSSSKQRGKRK
jgi:pyruvate-formate lyase